MNPSNQQFLEDNMQHLINARADFFKNLGGETRSRFEEIISQEFRPGYKADIGCDKCALEMMKILDIYYRQWKDSEAAKIILERIEKIIPEPVVKLDDLSVNPGRVSLAANFPSHKKVK